MSIRRWWAGARGCRGLAWQWITEKSIIKAKQVIIVLVYTAVSTAPLTTVTTVTPGLHVSVVLVCPCWAWIRSLMTSVVGTNARMLTGAGTLYTASKATHAHGRTPGPDVAIPPYRTPS